MDATHLDRPHRQAQQMLLSHFQIVRHPLGLADKMRAHHLNSLVLRSSNLRVPPVPPEFIQIASGIL